MRLPAILGRAKDDQGGVILVEVVVSGLLLVIVALGAFTAFDSATRSTAQERHRARANALAEADLSRMRSMRISALSNLVQTRTVVQDEQSYTITSRAEYQTDSAGTASCEAGAAAADYIKVSSTVTWPSLGNRPPLVSATLVAPPNGSIAPNSGALAIAVENAANIGIPGVGISGSGAGSFTGVTGSTGCVIFGNLPAGSYTVSVSGVANGLVDRDGKSPGPVTTSVVGESTNTLVLQYDDPGEIPVTFRTRNYANELVESAADSIVVYNTGLSVARVFGTVGTQLATQTASPMFPFTSDYAVYAGTCEGDNPNPLELDPPPAPAAIGSALVPPGGSAPVQIQLPALHLRAEGDDNDGNNVEPVVGATVRIRDTRCGNLLRTFNTVAEGRLANPGLPFSDYNVCVHGLVVDADSNEIRRRTINGISLNDIDDLTGGTVRTFYLEGSGSSLGECPA